MALSGARIGRNQTISYESKRVSRAFSLLISVFLVCRVPFFLWVYSTVDSKPWVPHQIFCTIIPRMTMLGVYLNAILNPLVYGSVNQQFLISAYWIELAIKSRFQITGSQLGFQRYINLEPHLSPNCKIFTIRGIIENHLKNVSLL